MSTQPSIPRGQANRVAVCVVWEVTQCGPTRQVTLRSPATGFPQSTRPLTTTNMAKLLNDNEIKNPRITLKEMTKSTKRNKRLCNNAANVQEVFETFHVNILNQFPLHI